MDDPIYDNSMQHWRGYHEVDLGVRLSRLAPVTGLRGQYTTLQLPQMLLHFLSRACGAL
jgi:hypothetical protein